MVSTGDRLINRVRDDTDMMSFYKAELPTEPDGWEESTIHEGLGGPDAHSDRFWRKGPYGIEQDSDGGFEAYVIVADTPFKIGDGFASFEEAVNHLTSQMQEKKVDGGDEEDSEEVTEDAEGEEVEKSLDGEIALGPEANSVGKSEDFEKSLDGAHRQPCARFRPSEVPRPLTGSVREVGRWIQGADGIQELLGIEDVLRSW